MDEKIHSDAFRTTGASASKTNGKQTKTFKYKCTFSGTVADAMRKRGWIECEDKEDDWDIFWCDLNQLKEVFAPNAKVVEDWQRVGHFRNCFEISRKNLLTKNLKKLKQRVERAFGKVEGEKLAFSPTTFVLPIEHKSFQEEFKKTASKDVSWIIKPAAGAKGRGIFIFNEYKDYVVWRRKYDGLFSQSNQLSSQSSSSNSTNVPGFPSDDIPNRNVDLARELNKNDIFVVQRYISNPYLIGGRKFDIRFYVLITSYIPLKAWVYREGFARFSAGQYSLEALQDVYIHLTNVAIQRTSEDYDPEKGSKWSLRNLREHFTARHGMEKVETLMSTIDNIVIRTLQSVYKSVTPDKRCFELYGFDVLIDSELRPWLLEVNASPSFTPSNEEDYLLKCALIDDAVSVLDLEGRLSGYEKRVGGFDMIWNDGPVYANPHDACVTRDNEDGPKLNSFLGCANDRVRQLRDIYRNAHFIKVAQGLIQSSSRLSGGSLSLNYKTPGKPTTRSADFRYQLPESFLLHRNQHNVPP